MSVSDPASGTVPARTTARVAEAVASAAHAPPHPLLESPLLRGLRPTTRDLLVQRFHAATPTARWGSRAAALAHLESLVRVWPVRSWQEVGGLHVFLGTSGSGKSTLVLKLARQLTQAGKKVAIVGLFPSNPMQAQSLRWAADLLRVSAACATRAADAAVALTQFARHDAILLETPCAFTHANLTAQLMTLPALLDVRTVVHWVLCVHRDAAFIERELAAAGRYGADYVGISQADLAAGPGAVVSLQLQFDRTLSLVNASPDLEAPLALGRDALLTALVRASR